MDLVELQSNDSNAIFQPTPAYKKLHLAHLDGIRALMALYVLLSHAKYQVYDSGGGTHGLAKLICRSLEFGHFAVTMFIMLSGFCLTLPVLKNNGVLRWGAVEFFKRRAIRILPPYYFALALSLVLIGTVIGKKTGTHWDCSIPVTTFGIVTHVLVV
jgi:peptidoglycan/LPS O-acetylase OafA/YrhL